MKIERSQLAAVIAEKTLHQTDMRRLTQAVAAYLMEQKSIDQLESLIRDILAYRQNKGAVEADIVSAHDLSQSALVEIKGIIKNHFPTASSVSVFQSKNENLIGGFKVKLAHEQLDMTLRSQLDTFKKLTEGIN